MDRDVGRDLLRSMMHAVGHFEVGRRYSAKPPYRNHFAAGADDVPGWELLCGLGLACKTQRPGALNGECPVYSVTPSGILFLRARRAAAIKARKKSEAEGQMG